MTAIYNVTLAYLTDTVTVGVTKPERTMGNLITNITIPKLFVSLTGTAQGSSGTTMIVNLRRIERRFNIDGYLASGLGTSDTHYNASEKETDIINMFQLGKGLTMTWIDGETYTVTLEKLSTERLLSDGIVSGDGEAEYVVKFSAIQGEDLIK